MVKLVDTPDLGSGASRRVGSSPIRRTEKESWTLLDEVVGISFLWTSKASLLPTRVFPKTPFIFQAVWQVSYYLVVTSWKMFQTSFSYASFRSAANDKSFGWEWFIVRLRTFYRLPQWKEAERWPPYPSFRNTLYESHLPYILKDERSFWKNLGGERMKKEDTSIRLLPFKCILLIYQPAWLP